MLKQIILIFILCVLINGSQIKRIDAQQTSKTQFVQVSIQEGIGVDVIEIGKSTTKDVIARYGKNYKLEKNAGYSNQITYADLGLSFYYCAKDRKKRVFLIEILNGTTSRGISVGNTLEDLLNIYGEPDDIINGVYEYKGIQFYIEDAAEDNSEEEQKPISRQKKIIEIDVVPDDKSSNFCDGI